VKSHMKKENSLPPPRTIGMKTMTMKTGEPFFTQKEEFYQYLPSENQLLRVEAIKISSHDHWGLHAIAIWASGFPLPRTPWGAAEPGTLLGPSHFCLTQIYNSLVL
jgi:hypothetical protein